MDSIARRKAKIVLAAVAVLGIGAVATSALWSDQVFFQGDVSVATFNIEGATGDAPTTWLESDTFVTPDLSTIELAFTDLGPLVAGQSATWQGLIRNDPLSTVNADVSAITVDTSLLSAALAAELTVTAAYDVPADALDVGPGIAVPFTVTVTLADDAPTTVMGATGTVVIRVVGSPVTAP
jgi:predicted ribosomally synthesized peptide with SipW-like signal peptide